MLAVSALLVAGCTAHGAGGAADGKTARSAGGSVSGGSASGGSATEATGSDGTRSGAATARPSIVGNGVVSRSDFASSGQTWPLTVTKGTLFCESGTQVIFTTPDGDAYGVNAAAQGDSEWSDIDRIRAEVNGSPADLGDLVAAGEQLC
jgi:hypothetical protein